MVHTEQEVAESIEDFLNFMTHKGTPYFEQYATLEGLNSIYPTFGDRSNLVFGPHGFFYYVATIAYLVDKPGFQNFQTGFYEELPTLGINDENIKALQKFVSTCLT